MNKLTRWEKAALVQEIEQILYNRLQKNTTPFKKRHPDDSFPATATEVVEKCLCFLKQREI